MRALYSRAMGLGRHAWRARARVLGEKRVVTMPVVREIGRSRILSLRGRARLSALLARELVAGPPRRARVRVGEAVVEIGGEDDFPVDWKAFGEIFAQQPYPAEYTDAVVLDVGAHKGYFGAYALARGATAVVSFEPATRNYAALARAAARFGDRWHARRFALGRERGCGTLHLDGTSWAHSLLAVKRPAGEELVEVLSLADALAELPRGARIIVKLDAEGSECDILAQTEALEPVDLLLVEWHDAAPCTVEDLSRLAEAGGLQRMGNDGGALRFARAQPDPERHTRGDCGGPRR